jgi:AcrR family transcriptional regulator
MSAEEVSIREKIILATIDCIEKHGIQNVTIRSIAKQAGVNSAAINYYFRTKENLMNEVMKSTGQHSIKDLEDLLKSEDSDITAIMMEFFLYLMDGAIRFPNLTKAHLYDALMLGRYDGIFVRRFNGLLSELANKIKASKKAQNKREITMKLVQVVSAVMLPALMPKMFRAFASVNFEDDATRKAYVSFLVEHFFA